MDLISEKSRVTALTVRFFVYQHSIAVSPGVTTKVLHSVPRSKVHSYYISQEYSFIGRYLLYQTILVVSDNICYIGQYLLYQTISVVSDNMCSIRQYLWYQTISVVSDNICCIRQYQLYQTISVVSQNISCIG